MPGWVDLGSDVSWDDHGGKWGRLAADGSVYVIVFENLDERGERPEYVCEVKRVDLPSMPAEQLERALKCVGLRREGDTIVSDSGDIVANRTRQVQYVLAEACISYGCAEPLDTFSGDKYPARVRASARRVAEGLMRDAAALEVRRQRPVNRIGSTAAEYGRGDIESALDRGPFDTGKNLMRKLHGLPPGRDE